MRETWYVLEDGRVADPRDVTPCPETPSGERLLHADGVAVAMRGDVPSTRGVDPAAERERLAAERARAMDSGAAGKPYANREMKTAAVKKDT